MTNNAFKPKKGKSVVDQRKQAISIRLGGSDLRNLKQIAKRLGVRDSDIIRFAIKSMLGRIAPLADEGIAGRDLVPVLVESGDELIRYFELDAFRLEVIINEHAADAARVDRYDIGLLAMSGLREQYLMMRMNGAAGSSGESVDHGRSLRNYLYEKYIFRSADARTAETVALTEVRTTSRPAA